MTRSLSSPTCGLTVWFTGLSASGKSTLSQSLYDSLQKFGIRNVVLLDGESIRDELKSYKFDLSNREKLGIYKAKIARNLNLEGKHVLISGIAHKKEWRKDIRSMIDNYYEIFLDCDVEKCADRDYKGNYKKAFSGELDNFIGVTEQYEISKDVDLVLDTGSYSVEKCLKIMLQELLPLLKTKENAL
jgi:adenylylsulfate kinase